MYMFSEMFGRYTMDRQERRRSDRRVQTAMSLLGLSHGKDTNRLESHKYEEV